MPKTNTHIPVGQKVLSRSGFHEALSHGRRDFHHTCFKEEIWWPDDTEMEGLFDFSHARFTLDMNIGDMRLKGELRFQHAHFCTGLYVFRSRIKILNLNDAKCDGPVSIGHTTIFDTIRCVNTNCQTRLWIEPQQCTELVLIGTKSRQTFISPSLLARATQHETTNLGEIKEPPARAH